ncbi:MAG: hypothetical protein ABSF09_03155 [Candidatus Bathyarchaeia archaeon]|jgi:dihydrodipicolinate reductase
MPIDVCVVGVTRKFGRSIISRTNAQVRITGADTSDSNNLIGALLACSWIASKDKAGVYAMQDVLGLT